LMIRFISPQKNRKSKLWRKWQTTSHQQRV
jgi:hypothetical protein